LIKAATAPASGKRARVPNPTVSESGCVNPPVIGRFSRGGTCCWNEVGALVAPKSVSVAPIPGTGCFEPLECSMTKLPGCAT
jgi:hypothetical protein